MSFAKILPLLIAAAPVALATPALAQSAAPTGPAAGITTQLPRGAAPSHYTIEVTPDAANLRFTGNTVIDALIDVRRRIDDDPNLRNTIAAGLPDHPQRL